MMANNVKGRPWSRPVAILAVALVLATGCGSDTGGKTKSNRKSVV